MKVKTRKKNKTLLISIISAILLAATVGTTFFYLQRQANESKDTSINYGPPTKEEVAASQDAKKQVLEETQGTEKPENNPSQQPELKEAVVNIAFADIVDQKLEVRAFTATTIEADGKCTVTVKKDDKNISGETSAFIDARSTICNPVFIPVSQLIPGSWEVTVNYLSQTHKGTSGPIKVEVKSNE